MVKNLPANAGDRDAGSVSGLERYPLVESIANHSSILAWRIPMDRRAWRVTVPGVTKSRT